MKWKYLVGIYLLACLILAVIPGYNRGSYYGGIIVGFVYTYAWLKYTKKLIK